MQELAQLMCLSVVDVRGADAALASFNVDQQQGQGVARLRYIGRAQARARRGTRGANGVRRSGAGGRRLGTAGEEGNPGDIGAIKPVRARGGRFKLSGLENADGLHRRPSHARGRGTLCGSDAVQELPFVGPAGWGGREHNTCGIGS